MKALRLTLAALAMVLLLCGSLWAADECAVNIRPNLITIGTNYDGMSLSVTGTVPAGSAVVLRMIGDRKELHLKQKGKVFGLLWMNLATVTIQDVPNVFLLGVDSDVYDAGSANWKGLNLGLDSLRGETDETIYAEFLKLKQGEGLYKVQEGVISYGPEQDGQRPFTASLAVPSALHKGIYEVQAFAVRDGAVVCQATQELHAELVGFPSLLADLAFNNSLIYGIAATIIAILAGLLMTVVFKDKGGAH